MSKGKFVAGVVTGALVGATAGVLFAPKSGAETRRELANKFNEVLEKAKTLKKEDAIKYIEDRIEKIKNELSSLDKEKVKKIAEKKAKEIGKELEQLVSFVKEKGNEQLEKAIIALRGKALEVSKEVVKKLEEA